MDKFRGVAVFLFFFYLTVCDITKYFSPLRLYCGPKISLDKVFFFLRAPVTQCVFCIRWMT